MRDVVDLLLLRDLIAATGSPTLPEIRAAGLAVFDARAAEAVELGGIARAWPPTIEAYAHWSDDFLRAAASGGIDLNLGDAVAEVNVWIKDVDLVGMLAAEAEAVERAEVESDPDEPFPRTSRSLVAASLEISADPSLSTVPPNRHHRATCGFADLNP